MNYFGHVALACEFAENFEFLLGAMLPDFANMIGCSPPACGSETLMSGIRFHLVTDVVFHQQPMFRQKVAAARRELEQSGVRKGPARAAAHVGVELLLDAELSSRRIHGLAYREALVVAAPQRVARLLHWGDAHAPDKFESLRLRLLERSTCRDHFSIDRLVERVAYVLMPRPRLRLWENEQRQVSRWIHSSSAPFGDALGTFWQHLKEQVSTHWSAPTAKMARI